MERAGLVERKRDPADRRSYALVSTRKAGTALADMERAADQANAQLTSVLADRERQDLDRMLQKIAGAGDRSTQRPTALTARTVHLLSLAHHAVSESFAQRLREIGLTPPLYGTLRTLDASGPTSQQAIAEQLGLSGTAILQAVDRLEADELVKRHRNQNDRRSYALELTPEGRNALGQASAALDAISAELDHTLDGPKQQQRLQRLLLKMLAPGDHR